MASFPDVQRVSQRSAQAEHTCALRVSRLVIDQSAVYSNAARDADVAHLELATLQGGSSASHRTRGGGA